MRMEKPCILTSPRRERCRVEIIGIYIEYYAKSPIGIFCQRAWIAIDDQDLDVLFISALFRKCG
jgi:hypothetical protein